MRTLRPLKSLQHFSEMKLLVGSLFASYEFVLNICLVGLSFNFIFAVFGHTYIGDRFGHRCLDLTNYTAGPCSFSDLSECTAAQLAVNEFQSNYRQYMEGGSLYYMEEFDHYCGPNALDAYRDDYENYLARTGDYPPQYTCGHDPLPFNGTVAPHTNYTCVQTYTGTNLNVTRYNTIGWSMLTTFDIANLEGWREKLRVAQLVTDNDYIFIYFYTTIFFLNVLVMNLFPAVMSFNLRRMIRVDEEEKEHIQLQKKQQEQDRFGGDTRELSQFEEHMVKLQLAEDVDVKFVQSFIETGQVKVDADDDRLAGVACVPQCKPIVMLRKMIENELGVFCSFIYLMIILNVVTIACDGYNAPPKLVAATTHLNVIFSCIFYVEFMIKILLMGPIGYVKDPYNRFDCMLAHVSMLDVVASNVEIPGFSAMRVVRLFRLARVLRLLSIAKIHRKKAMDAAQMDLKRLMGIVASANLYIVSIFVLKLLMLFIFGILGMQFFGCRVYALAADDDFPIQPYPGYHPKGTFNFDTFPMAFASALLITTLDDWNTIMYEAIARLYVGQRSVLYFIFLIVIVRYVVMSMLVAVLFDQVERDSILVVQESARSLMMSVYMFEKALSRGFLRYNFQKWIKNVEKPDDDKKDSGRSKAQVQLMTEAPPPPTQLQLLMKSDKSLFLFSPKNPIRRGALFIAEGAVFPNLVFLAITISVALLAFEIEEAVGARTLSCPVASLILVLETICTIVFVGEMLMLMIGHMATGRNAYLSTGMNFLDFVVNVCSIISLVFALNAQGFPSMAQLNGSASCGGEGSSGAAWLKYIKILRMVRVTRPLKKLVQTPALKAMLDAMSHSQGTMKAILIVVGGALFMFAVFGMQLFQGTLFYCSTAQMHPAGVAVPDYPLKIDRDKQLYAWTCEYEACRYDTGECFGGQRTAWLHKSQPIYQSQTGVIVDVGDLRYPVTPQAKQALYWRPGDYRPPRGPFGTVRTTDRGRGKNSGPRVSGFRWEDPNYWWDPNALECQPLNVTHNATTPNPVPQPAPMPTPLPTLRTNAWLGRKFPELVSEASTNLTRCDAPLSNTSMTCWVLGKDENTMIASYAVVNNQIDGDIVDHFAGPGCRGPGYEWKNMFYNWDNIYEAFRSAFVVFSFDDWHQIFLGTISSNDIDKNVGVQFQITALWFFILIATSTYLFVYLFIGGIYGTFVYFNLTQNRGRICSLKQAMWTVYETKLQCIHPINNPIRPTGNIINKARGYLFDLATNPLVMAAISAAVIFDAVLVFIIPGTLENPRDIIERDVDDDDERPLPIHLMYIDRILCLVFIGEFIVKLLAFGPLAIFTSLREMIRFVVILFVAYNVMLDTFPSMWASYTHAGRCIIFSLRSLQVFLVLPMWETPMMMLRCISISLTMIVPMLVVTVLFTFMYGVIAVLLFDHAPRPECFRTETCLPSEAVYRFRRTTDAMETFFASSTANDWATLAHEMAADQDLGTARVAIGFILIFTYVVVIRYVVLNMCMLIILYRYELESPYQPYLAMEQVQEFRKAWHKTDELGLGKIPAYELPYVLRRLKKPLGVGEKCPKMLADRASRMLLMATSTGEWTWEIVQLDFGSNKDGVDAAPELREKYLTFTDAIIAIHRVAMFPELQKLPDDAAFRQRREFAQGKLDVARLAVNRHITGKEQQMHRGTGPRQFAGLVDMSLVQRTRPDVFRYRMRQSLTLETHRWIMEIKHHGFNQEQFEECEKLYDIVSDETAACEAQRRVLNLLVQTSPTRETQDRRHRLNRHLGFLHSLEARIKAQRNEYVTRIWKTKTMEEKGQLRCTKRQVTATVVDREGRLLVTTSSDRMLMIWKKRRVTRDMEEALDAMKAKNEAAARAKGGEEMKDAGALVKAQLPTPFTHSQTFKLEQVSLCLCATHDLKRFYTTGGEMIQGWVQAKRTAGQKKSDVSYRTENLMHGHSSPINALILVEKCQKLFSCSDDGTVKMWNLKGNSECQSISVGAGPLFALCYYNAKLDSENEDMKGLHVVTGGAEGSIAMLPFETSSKWLNTANWTYHPEAKKVAFEGSFGTTAIETCHGKIYAGSSHGWICVYTPVRGDQDEYTKKILDQEREDNKGKKNKELSINEKSIVRIVFEARVQCHSDAVSCLLVAGGTLFSAGHDFAIVTWLAPELEEHDEVNELGRKETKMKLVQGFESARVVHNGAVLCMTANENQLISGDAVGTAMVQAPRKYYDKPQIRPKPNSSLDPNETVLEKPRFLKQQDLKKLKGPEFLAHLLWHYYPIKKLVSEHGDDAGFKLGAEVLFQKVPDDPDAPWYKGMYLGESQDTNLPEHLVIDPGDGEPVEELPRAQVKAEAHVTGVQVGQYIQEQHVGREEHLVNVGYERTMKASDAHDADHDIALADHHHSLEMQERRAGEMTADNLAAAEQAASAEERALMRAAAADEADAAAYEEKTEEAAAPPPRVAGAPPPPPAGQPGDADDAEDSESVTDSESDEEDDESVSDSGSGSGGSDYESDDDDDHSDVSVTTETEDGEK